MGGLLGGPKGMLAPPLKLLGGAGPPTPPPSSYAYAALTDPKLEVLAKFIPESPKMTPVKLVKFSRICFNTR